ncbi:hypothetical protein MHYP_G00136300 [Metynnis hypsauchen]
MFMEERRVQKSLLVVKEGHYCKVQGSVGSVPKVFPPLVSSPHPLVGMEAGKCLPISVEACDHQCQNLASMLQGLLSSSLVDE